MKRFLFLTLMVWSQLVFGQSEPITSLQGDGQASKFTSPKIIVPNQQATKMTRGGRIETGNKNLLANPSFEATTVSTGWTCAGGGTSATSTTNLQDGISSMTRTSTGAWSCYQDVTQYATAKSGQEAEASIWVYSATASAVIWVCPRTNGTTPTASVANGCVQYSNLGLPQKISVFPLFGSTSTGISISGTGAITYILDDAYLGDRRPNVFGITTTPETSCGLTTSDFTGFGTVSAIQVNCERIGGKLKITGNFTSGTSTAVEARLALKMNGVSLTSANSTIIPSIRVARGTYWKGISGTSQEGAVLIEPSVGYVTFSGILQTSGSVSALSKGNGSAIASSGEVVSIYTEVPITEWAGDANAFTTKCDDPRQCETVFTAFVSGAGVVSNENLDWLSSSTCTLSGSNNAEKTCNFNPNIFTVAPNCFTTVNLLNDQLGTILVNGTTSVAMRSSSGGAGSTGSQYVICQKQGIDYTLANMTQQIVQMREVMYTPGVTRPVTASAVVSASGAVSNEIGDLISGSCSNSHGSTCTLNTSVIGSSPNCTIQSQANNCYCDGVASGSSLSIVCFVDSGAACTQSAIKTVTCHGSL